MPAVAWWFSKAVSRSTWGWRDRALATAVAPRVVGVSGTLGDVSVSGLTSLVVSVLSGLVALSSALLTGVGVGFLGGFLFRFLGFLLGFLGGFAVVLVGCALHFFEDG